MWLDAEAGVHDPGLALIAPGVLGAAMPAAAYGFGAPDLPPGVPGAIASGIVLGAGEGALVSTYQFARSSSGDTWGFRENARAIMFGATVGGGAGWVAAATAGPVPRASLFLDSAALWGGAIGTMAGFGASDTSLEYGLANDSGATGALVGYSAGVIGAAALSPVWAPTYKSLAWMWGGFCVGTVATTPVYLLYLGRAGDARRGLVVQGAGGMVGVVAGALLTINDADYAWAEGAPPLRALGVRITGAAVGPAPGGGLVLNLNGVVF